MMGTNTEERLAALEQAHQFQNGQIEALGIALASTVALLREIPPFAAQTLLVKQLEALAMAHSPLPDEHHTRGFHQTLTAIAGNLKADLEEN
ncbi:MAG: hypothetical protein CSA85_00540 [Alphaproteobacteria bacterium]|nr:MAG: hypothetical protein CSA85_00540 [Alphaproteobacteria bacterium]